MKYSLSSKVIFPWGTAGAFGVSARNTLPRIDLGPGGELGGSTGTTSPGTNLGTAGAFGVSARNTLPRIDLGPGG
ncbi:hypothetical protein ACTFXL_26135, partial [Pseudomonas aeruginosa]|nr:hypothetical protein [Pseudomonas aeruginosa]